MQQFLNNRYVRLVALTLGIGALFFAVIWIVCTAIGLRDLPVILQALLALLGSGVVVYKFLAGRIF